MSLQIEDTDELPVIRCLACMGRGCRKCDRTGKVFWVGRAFPYTPEGEQDARRSLKPER